MAKRAISFSDFETGGTAIALVAQCSVSKLRHFADGWFLDSEIERHSEATLTNRRFRLSTIFSGKRKKLFEGTNDFLFGVKIVVCEYDTPPLSKNSSRT